MDCSHQNKYEMMSYIWILVETSCWMLHWPTENVKHLGEDWKLIQHSLLILWLKLHKDWIQRLLYQSDCKNAWKKARTRHNWGIKFNQEPLSQFELECLKNLRKNRILSLDSMPKSGSVFFRFYILNSWMLTALHQNIQTCIY